jgi:hypothetical protein
MNNLRTWLFAITLVTGASFAVCDAAQAQGYKVKTDSLEKTTWFKSKRIIHIVDESPTVIDHRTAPVANDTYTVNVAPLAASGGGRNIVISASPSALPKAGFESNVPLRSAAPANLPSAKSTNMLAGRFTPPAVAKPGSLLRKPIGTGNGNQATNSKSTVIATYAPIKTPSAAIGGSLLNSSSNVHGKLVPRGQLLGK